MYNPLRFSWKIKRRFLKWNTADIEKHQRKQISKLIKSSLKKSKFYSTFYNGYDLADHAGLPFMNKQLFMDNFTDLNTKGLTIEECIKHCLDKEKTRDFSQYHRGFLVGMSTGTSGNRGIEFVTKYEALLMQILVFFRFPFPKAKKIHLAFILRVFSPGFGHEGRKIKVSYVNPLDTIPAIVNNLNSLNPNIISGSPSVLQVLAKEKQNGKLSIEPLLLVSYGEVLDADVKEEVEKIFECSIVEAYKSSESFIALPCKSGNLHINEDTVFVEVLDKENKPVEPGKPGYVVVTDFIKYGSPIIRYRLNDLITVSPDFCPCGSKFRVIEQIHGRADDVIYGKSISTEEYQFILPDFVRRSIVSSSDYIEEYRSIQNNPTSLTISLQLNKEIEKMLKKEEVVANIENSIRENISTVFQKHESQVPELNFKYEQIVHDFDKKLRRIQRNFK